MGRGKGLKAGIRFLGAVWLALACLLLASSPAAAQSPPPNPSNIDEHGVDLVSGKQVFGTTEIQIGPDDHHGLSFGRQYGYNAWYPGQIPVITGSTSNPIVSFRGASYPFTLTGGVYVPKFPDGSTLNSARTVFTSSDGTIIEFGITDHQYPSLPGYGLGGIGTKITYPDGVIWNYNYNTELYGTFQWWCACWEYYNIARLSSITSSTGYQIKLTYQSNTPPYDAYSYIPWATLTKATALNNAIEYCDPVGACTFANIWPEATYSGFNVTGPGGGTTTYTPGSGGIGSITLPGDTSPSITFTYNSSNQKVASVTKGGGTWNYSFGTNTATVTDPFSTARTVNFNSTGQVTSATAGGQTTSYAYCPGTSWCPAGLLQTVTMPEGNATWYTYDARGNTVSTTHVAKPSSGLANIVTSAAYPSSCTNVKTCNKPTSTTDARGQVTDYTYDIYTGILTTVTSPADSNGVRPQTRIGLINVSARYLTAPGTYSTGVAFANPWVIASCRVATSGNPASCAGTADEGQIVLSYLTNGSPTNGQVVQINRRNGNLSFDAATYLGYDNYGNVVSIDGPQSGTADRSMLGYRLDGQVAWQIGPDPDGAGSARHPATYYVYRSDGQLDNIQYGTVTTQPDPSWSTWTRNNVKTFGYDSYHRRVREALYDGGPTTGYQVSDLVYDSAGRPLCSILRMDQSQFGALPGVPTSCSPTSGSQGPDRVTYNHYDALNRVWKVTTAYGTADAADDQISTFTANGQLQTLTDAEGNKTTYSYNGHDRLVQTNFPHLTTDGVSSSTDYDQVGYDANGNVTSFRTRRGETLTMTYDNLNRMTVKVVPERSGLATTHTRDVYFGYDLFGGMTHARFDSHLGEGTTNAYDALGRQTASVTTMDGVTRTLEFGYSTTNERISLQYPDGNFIRYYYNDGSRDYGAFYVSYLNAASPLFYRPLDSQARPTNIYQWHTSGGHWYAGVTGYYYDAVSRLSAIAYDLGGTTYDGYDALYYNPAYQIASEYRSNDNFAFTSYANVNRGYAANGLNQYGAVGGTSFAYDGNGNLTSDGTDSYVYDVENRMVSRTSSAGTVTMRYDPLGRMHEIYAPSLGTGRRFLYDGSDLVAEYNFNSYDPPLRRYVHGLGAGDDPLVWFEGGGVSDSARRYLYADERGSIIAVTDSSGNVLNVNRYDEYGVPASGNAGAFQYTGQVWLPELGMYYYKARMYSPTLGRFMQTDPIGYGDGMNMYAYVSNDPVGKVDPTGTVEIPCVTNNDTIFVCGDRIRPPSPPTSDELRCMEYYNCMGYDDYCARFGCNNAFDENPCMLSICETSPGEVIWEYFFGKDDPVRPPVRCPVVDRLIDVLTISGIAADGVTVVSAATVVGEPVAVAAAGYSRLASAGNVVLYGLKGDGTGALTSLVGVAAGAGSSVVVRMNVGAGRHAIGAGGAGGGIFSLVSYQRQCR